MGQALLPCKEAAPSVLRTRMLRLPMDRAAREPASADAATGEERGTNAPDQTRYLASFFSSIC